MKIRPVGAELLHADGQTDMAKVTFVIRIFRKAPTNLPEFYEVFSKSLLAWPKPTFIKSINISLKHEPSLPGKLLLPCILAKPWEFLKYPRVLHVSLSFALTSGLCSEEDNTRTLIAMQPSSSFHSTPLGANNLHSAIPSKSYTYAIPSSTQIKLNIQWLRYSKLHTNKIKRPIAMVFQVAH
jgi:hypothetical protein